MSYTVGTLFSGIGVPDLCARLLGMTTVWQVEKEAFPQAVLRKNFPEAALHGDIFDCHDLPYVDVCVAGFPCQPFSLAGKQQGDRDPRYLVPEMLRVIDEVRPRIILLENVPGFASLDDGKSFKSLLQALAEMGLDAEWGHIRASDVGAPHQRERWFLVGYASHTRLAQSRGWNQSQSQQFATLHHDREGRNALGYPNQSERKTWRSDRLGKTQSTNPFTRYGELGNTQCGGRSGYAWRRTEPQSEKRYARYGRTPQPRLGRVFDGIANGVDGFIAYPARPGQPQFAFEPPRVTTRNDSRSARLKALGNSMAVDVVFEIMLAVRTWLEAADAAEREAA